VYSLFNEGQENLLTLGNISNSYLLIICFKFFINCDDNLQNYLDLIKFLSFPIISSTIEYDGIFFLLQSNCVRIIKEHDNFIIDIIMANNLVFFKS